MFGLESIFELLASDNIDALDEPIYYGDEIRLRHYSTKRVLCVSEFQDSLESDSLLCHMVMNKESSVRSIFKVLPKYKTRSEGENVLIEDHIMLYSEAYGGVFGIKLQQIRRRFY